ncbi:MAG TPA: hypothetical protein VNC62_01625 [Burkholderiales bacterium]|nr:hypothetical protein [Burkholderiales bacterium]HVJ24987.1 hypothetical protein [Burkholderiales bacterium]
MRGSLAPVQQSLFGHSMLDIALGPPAVEFYDQVLQQVFEKVTRVDGMDAKHVDVLVVPSLEHFDLPYGISALSGYRAEEHGIAFRTTLYDRSGAPLASWVTQGTADHRSGMLWASASRFNLLQAYLADARQKFLAGFEREALVALAARREAAPAPEDLKTVALGASVEAFPDVDAAHAARLRARGVIAVRVTARSPLERALVVRASDMRLRLADGRMVEPAARSAMAQSRQHTFVPPKPTLLEAVSPLLGDPVLNVARGEVGPVYAADSQQQLAYQLLASASFGERTLGPGREEQGFVFFHLAPGPQVRDAQLTGWIVDPRCGCGSYFVSPLGDALQ